jgi:hypothetical protein
MSQQLPYGSWPSPLTASWASSSSLRLDGAGFVGDEVWWGESLPDEAGRVAVMRRRGDGEVEVVLPAPWNARSRVHEYGGGAWAVSDDGDLFFVDKSDQRVRRLRPGGEPEALTPDESGTHYGGLRWQRGVLLAVRERERSEGTPERHIVRIDGVTGADASGVTELAGGSDFVAQPALSPDGSHLAWVAWDHPDMPWDRTRIRVVDLRAPHRVRDVAGGSTAALQPEWTPDGQLLVVDEPTGRWNLYRVDPGADANPAPISPTDADTGGGLWVLGTRWYAPLDDGRVVAVRTHGSDQLVVIDRDGGAVPLPVPATARLQIEDVAGSSALVSGTMPGATGLWIVDLDSGEATAVRGGAPDVDAAWIPHARQLTTEGPTSCRRTSCGYTAVRPRMWAVRRTARWPTSPVAASACSTSTTAARRATAARTANG